MERLALYIVIGQGLLSVVGLVVVRSFGQWAKAIRENTEEVRKVYQYERAIHEDNVHLATRLVAIDRQHHQHAMTSAESIHAPYRKESA